MAEIHSSILHISVAATFTADPLRPSIAFWARETNRDFDVRFAPFNQVVQSLLDPASELLANTHGAVWVLLRLEDLASDLASLDSNVHHLAEELRAAPERLSVPIIVMLCPSRPGSPYASGFERYESFLEAALDDTPGAQFIPSSSLQGLYPVASPFSPEGERLGGIPYSEAWFCAAGTMLVRHMLALLRPPYKLIALDCDNTLWDGICGEDGPENVRLDEPRRALQKFMLCQRDDGMLLSLASKNNEEDVLETFRLHPEMPLELRHFVTWRLNWDLKSMNLASIASQLSLGLDSFIFVDDSPKECEELSGALPEVLTLALPADITKTEHFLNHVWAFDRPVVTEEDRNRNAYYERAAEFGNAVRRARSLADFIASLQLRVDVAPMTPATLARVAQLTQRTNQFNTTTIRRSEGELQSLQSAGAEILTVHVADRFGDYGLVGVMILMQFSDSLTIDNMLLSCRALGRGVEHRLLAEVARLALGRGLTTLRLPFERTQKNHPAMDFVSGLPSGEWRDQVLYLRAGELADLEWSPSTVVRSTAPACRNAPLRKSATAVAVDYTRVANELSTVSQILEAMRAGIAVALDMSMSDTERTLAAIWAELLEKPVISRSDNFFDLGGHSLVAVLLLMRIREAFGVELHIDDVYTGGLTLAGLAVRIEAMQAGLIDSDEYAAILAEIESITDEEALELLAREDGQS